MEDDKTPTQGRVADETREAEVIDLRVLCHLRVVYQLGVNGPLR